MKSSELEMGTSWGAATILLLESEKHGQDTATTLLLESEGGMVRTQLQPYCWHQDTATTLLLESERGMVRTQLQPYCWHQDTATTLLLESERGMIRTQLPGLTSSISCANSSLHKNVGFQSSLISLAADWTEISANRKVSIIIIKSEFWWGWIYGSETKDVWLHGHDYWIVDFSNLPLCFLGTEWQIWWWQTFLFKPTLMCF